MKRIVLTLLAAAALAGTSAQASFECYLKMQPIVLGESTAEGHTNEITVRSFAFDLNHPVGAAQRSDLILTKLLDKASPLLALRCAEGTVFQDATITCRSADPGQPIFYKITLVEVTITQVSVSASTADNRPQESVALRFNRMRWEYYQILPDGSQGPPVRQGWDFQLQRPY